MRKINTLDFKSLENNDDWKAVRKLYQDNLSVFSVLIEDMIVKYGLTEIEARDIFLSELISCHYKRKQRILLSDGNKIKWLFIYIVTILGLLLNGLVSVFILKRHIKRNIIFEEMFSVKGWSLRFYRYIPPLMARSETTQAVLYTHPGISKDFFNKGIEGWDGEVINRRLSGVFFDFKNSFSVAYKEFYYFLKLYRLSKNININIIYLYLRFLRKYLTYSSQVKNIEADVILAAGDYYWNPIKYILYKKKIKHVILLQHNFKNEYLHNRMLQYCDYYYAHSNQAIQKLEGIPFAKKYSIGSFQLAPYLDKRPIKYDILFINQTVNDDLKNAWPSIDQDKLIKSYYLLINNFKIYLEKNINIKSVYVAKGESINSEPSKTVRDMYSSINNIEFTGTYGPKTFELIKQSRVVINMYSSVGFEAYGFDKRVLWVNYNGCCDLFKYDLNKESLHVLRDHTDFETFEERVDLLLTPNKGVDEYYKKLKEKYMNIQENPAKIVAEKIGELI